MRTGRIEGLCGDVDAWVSDGVCTATIQSAGGRNTITPGLVRDLGSVLAGCDDSVRVLVLRGNAETFCFGADFGGVADGLADAASGEGADPGGLYDLWLRMTRAPFAVVSHVRGRANAGGIGFVAASDLVVADESASFSLSELLFGLYPAMVLPFLVRRTGWQRAHSMTMTTTPIPARRAQEWGLVDDCVADSESLLKRHLRRLRMAPPGAVGVYKAYMATLALDLGGPRDAAVAANRSMFAAPETVTRIQRYQLDGVYPWETVR
jgi:polyketide biosynthesis enoyl-CoA hydratase PksH